MIDNNAINLQIESYLNDDLQAGQKVRLERQLESDPQLWKEFILRKEINEAIKETEAMALRATVQSVMNKKKQRVIVLRRMVASAAIFILLFGAGTFFYTINNSYTPDQIYNTYYSAYELDNMRGKDQVSSEYIMQARELFRQKDYVKAIVMFEKAIEKEKRFVEGNFYKGMSQMEIKEYKGASASFAKVIEKGRNPLIEQSQWYLSFCYLKLGETKEAKDLLTIISSKDQHYKKTEATQILKKLD